jgi:hypothetical protein
VNRALAAAPRRRALPGVALALSPLCALLFLLPRGGWIFAFAAPLALWPTFASAIRADRDGAAFRAAVAWAVLLSAGVLLFVRADPETAATTIVRGESYRSEMFRWIETGQGREGSWRLFLPEHALHLAAFALLALLSGGYLGLALGAALLAYMNYFVASVVATSGGGFVALAGSWFPWSIARVLAFIAFGVLLARPVLRRAVWPFERRHRRWLALASLGIATDLLLKTLFAEEFRERLVALLP